MARCVGTLTSTFGGGGATNVFCSQALKTTNADRAKAIRETLAIPRRLLPSGPVHAGECVGIIPGPQLCFDLEIFGPKENFRHS
jgi:hypothetical protein